MREGEVCDTWTDVGHDVHAVYEQGQMKFRMKIHLPGNSEPIFREFSPPNKMLQGACNNYVKLLALGFKYGGTYFKRELHWQATKMLHEVKMQKYLLYKTSHEYIRAQNEKEVNTKVKTTDANWKASVSKRDSAWKAMFLYKYLSWRILSLLYCLLPAAIPIFIPPAKFLKVPLSPAIRDCNDDCAFMWPLNGDCPICLLYGPAPVDIILEAVFLILYLMGPPKDKLCADPADVSPACKGLDFWNKGMPRNDKAADTEPDENTSAKGADHDGDGDGSKGDGDGGDASSDKAPAEPGAKAEKEPAGGGGGGGGDGDGGGDAKAGGGGDAKADGDGGGGDGDGGGELGGAFQRTLRATTANSAVSGLGSGQRTQRLNRQRYGSAPHSAAKPVASVRSVAPKHHLIRKAVLIQAGSTETTNSKNSLGESVGASAKVQKELHMKRWQQMSPEEQKQEMKHERSQKLKRKVPTAEQKHKTWLDKFEAASPEQRLAQISQERTGKEQLKLMTLSEQQQFKKEKQDKKLSNMSPKKRERYKRINEQRIKIDRLFAPARANAERPEVSPNLSPNLPKAFREQLDSPYNPYANPFIEHYGPLPKGWHSGQTVEGLNYYWHDSGAKQLSLPAAPYLSKIVKTKISPEQIKWGVERILAINGWGKKWGAEGDPSAEILKLVQPIQASGGAATSNTDPRPTAPTEFNQYGTLD